MASDVPLPASPATSRFVRRLGRLARRVHAEIGTVQHLDPIRRATAQAFAYVLAALATTCAAMVLIGPLAGAPWPGVMATAALGGGVVLLWRLNRRGSLLPPWICAIAGLLIFPLTFHPDTYINVAGHPVTHLLFVVPVLIVTFFAHPAAGLFVIPLQVAALLIPVGTSYPQNDLLAFAATATFNLGIVYAIGASISLFLRSSLREMAQLNATLEQRVAERTHDLSVRNAELAQARKALAQTMRQAAHDIRNLLGQHLDDGEKIARAVRRGKTEEALRLCRSVEANVRLLAGLVSDLQESGTAVTGQLTLTPRRVSLTDLSRQVCQELDFAIQEAGITYTIQGDELCAWCDARRILRVMLNIVGNAVKFIGTGHQITVRVTQRDSWIVWQCQDDGIGIHPEKLAEMGKEFARLVHGDGAPGGTGIGLHFCGIIARLSGGDIQYYSAGESLGTTVTVLLPVCKDEL